MTEEKVEIRYNIRKDACFDFGMLNSESTHGTFKIARKLWEDYCYKRLAFEVMHDKLIGRIPERLIKKKLEGKT